MLQLILNAMTDCLYERSFSSTVYCGWGTSIDEMRNEYLDAGGSVELLREVEQLAQKKADYRCSVSDLDDLVYELDSKN